MKEFIRTLNKFNNFLRLKIKPVYIQYYLEPLAKIKRGEYLFRPFIHWLLTGHLICRWRIRKYFKQVDSSRNLQVGGGRHVIKGWLNADLIDGDIFLDATCSLPFRDSSFDYIFTEHFIEHLSRKEGIYFVVEAFRVLKPGGVLRLGTPSLRALMEIYIDNHQEISRSEVMDRHNRIHKQKEVCSTAAEYFNDVMRRWGHQFIFDEETLESTYQESGFINIKRVRFGVSEHSTLQNLERHAEVEWVKSAFVIIYEGQKPKNKIFK